MNRRFRLLVLVLLTAVLFLSAAIASLAFSGSGKPAKKNGEQAETTGKPVSLFVQNGLWGARTANGRVLIEPTWYYLRAMSDSVLIARRSDGKQDRFGLIRTNGEQLVPFLYSAFEPRGNDLWIAALSENGTVKYHLYHADGTRWINRSWDSAEYTNGVLSVKEGESSYQGTLSGSGGGITWTNWQQVCPVGISRLVMNLDEEQLRKLPAADVLQHLGSSCAEYLTYLFITRTPPEDARISAEDPGRIKADRYYTNCRFRDAAITRVLELKTDRFPMYTVWMDVRFEETDSSGNTQNVRTGMTLQISRNATGDYTFFSFTDARLEATGGALQQ